MISQNIHNITEVYISKIKKGETKERIYYSKDIKIHYGNEGRETLLFTLFADCKENLKNMVLKD